MRIVDVCAFYSPHGGGVRTYIHRKMAAAPALGHHLIVLAPGPHERIEVLSNGSILHTIPAPAMPLDRRYHYFDDEAALHLALDRWRPDHVEASSPWSSATLVGRWKGSASRSLVMHADPLASFAYRWFESVARPERVDRWFEWFWRHLRGLDRMFDLVVAPSEAYGARLSAGGLRKVVAVPLGTDPIFSNALRCEDERRDWLRRLGLDSGGRLLLGVGRFSAEKRWRMVIDAAGEAGMSTNLGLVLIGDGPGAARLRRLASRYVNVAIAGPIADRAMLARLMASADGLVHGCESETFGLAAAEAKASGLAVIVPDRGGAAVQATEARDLVYRSGSQRDLYFKLLQFAAGVRRLDRPAHPPQPARSLDEHFAELFALYCSGSPLGAAIELANAG